MLAKSSFNLFFAASFHFFLFLKNAHLKYNLTPRAVHVSFVCRSWIFNPNNRKLPYVFCPNSIRGLTVVWNFFIKSFDPTPIPINSCSYRIRSTRYQILFLFPYLCSIVFLFVMLKFPIPYPQKGQ